MDLLDNVVVETEVFVASGPRVRMKFNSRRKIRAES